MARSLRVWWSLGLFGAASTAGLFGPASCTTPVDPGEEPGGGGKGGSGLVTDPVVGTIYPDFPPEPQFDGGATAALTAAFTKGDAAAAAGGDPCLTDPAPDAMVPKNWSPLRFEWASASMNLFELRLKVKNQRNEFVVYTDKPEYTFSAELWSNLTSHSAGQDLELTLRGAKVENGAVTAGPVQGTKTAIHLAPVDAPGAVVYWSISTTAKTAFKGFSIGETTARNVITPEEVGGDTICVSCHTSSAAGDYTLFTQYVQNRDPQGALQWAKGRDAVGNPLAIVTENTGDPIRGNRFIKARALSGSDKAVAADKLSPFAAALLARSQQSSPITSKAFGSMVLTGADAALVASSKTEIVWTNLQAADGDLTPGKWWGVLQRNGDPGWAGSMTWSHDGQTVYYTSSPFSDSGVNSQAFSATQPAVYMDLYSVPYAGGKGGTATPLPGASEANYFEYYPVVSPDDKLLAFNRTPNEKKPDGTWRSSTRDPKAEVMVMPLGGGTQPITLKANQPAACAVAMKPELQSPGITNSWPKWAPSAGADNGKKYYWLVFSSDRQLDPAKRHAQLYLAAIVTKVNGNQETIEANYPAFSMSAQDKEDSNFIPAWDVFDLGKPGPH